jgi:hypothetical protein
MDYGRKQTKTVVQKQLEKKKQSDKNLSGNMRLQCFDELYIMAYISKRTSVQISICIGCQTRSLHFDNLVVNLPLSTTTNAIQSIPIHLIGRTALTMIYNINIMIDFG